MVVVKEVIVPEVVPFAKTTREDGSLAAGTSKVTTAGVQGTKSLTYQVTMTDGVETARVLVKDIITKPPVDEVTTVGTYVAPKPAPAPAAKAESGGCDPNYSGCVPIASDVDCAGGKGNGPKYVQGPVRVIGKDIYDLDSNGDGVGCE